MSESSETPSETVMVTAKAPMSILRREGETREEAFKRELQEEMSPERLLAFFEDASFEVEPISEK